MDWLVLRVEVEETLEQQVITQLFAESILRGDLETEHQEDSHEQG